MIIGPPGAGKTTALVNSGPEIPAVARRHAGGHRRRRRHALLRLVVHRGRGADRHRRPLHDAGFRRQGRQARAGSPSSTCSRRTGRGSRSTASWSAISLEDLLTLSAGGARRACRRDPRAPARAARPAQGRLPGLCAVHQGRPGRRLHRIFRRSRRERAASRSGAPRSRPHDKTRNMVGEVPVEFDALIERLNERTARPPAGRAGAEHARRCCSASRPDGAR